MQMRKGFTLIELLVVIAIIGILATLVITQVSGAQQKARNANAKSDVTQGGKAIELYKNDDTNGTGNIVTVSADATLTASTTGGGTPAIPTMFTGTFALGTTYAAGITKSPSSSHIYRYEVGTQPAYSLWTTVTTNDTTFCIKGGVTINGTDTTTAPTGCSL
jgi:prepilin-type N-terminal cleavage/methylation domain-containing protein